MDKKQKDFEVPTKLVVLKGGPGFSESKRVGEICFIRPEEAFKGIRVEYQISIESGFTVSHSRSLETLTLLRSVRGPRFMAAEAIREVRSACRKRVREEVELLKKRMDGNKK